MRQNPVRRRDRGRLRGCPVRRFEAVEVRFVSAGHRVDRREDRKLSNSRKARLGERVLRAHGGLHERIPLEDDIRTGVSCA